MKLIGDAPPLTVNDARVPSCVILLCTLPVIVPVRLFAPSEPLNPDDAVTVPLKTTLFELYG